MGEVDFPPVRPSPANAPIAKNFMQPESADDEFADKPHDLVQPVHIDSNHIGRGATDACVSAGQLTLRNRRGNGIRRNDPREFDALFSENGEGVLGRRR
jgi:hypothetical protein